MANNFSAFFETLLAGAGEYNKAKVGRVKLLDCVYKDISAEAARIGQTIDVYFPDVGPMTPINNGQLVASNVAPNYMPMVFQTRLGKGLQFQDFEQWQTATQLAEKFFDPLYKRAMEAMNGQIASLINTTNFNANAPIISGTQGEVTVAAQSAAWGVMADQKVPIEDPEDLALLIHNQVQGKMQIDSAWVQENVVSAAIAQKAREQATLSNAFNFRPIWDQQMPTASGKVIYGQIGVTNGSATVTGVASGFTTDLAVGNWLTFGSDTTNTPYQVSAIASDTSLTLSSNYTGATVAQTSARVQTILVGTVALTNGSATVTGTGTSFTTALSVGQWLVFSNDATKTPYQVLSIASNTSLTLAANYTGATASGLSATVLAYTCIAMHKYAIGLALRPIATPKEAANVVDVTYIDLKGIPLRVMISYVHIYQALFVTVDFGFALKVLRPDFGIIINC